MTKRGYSGIDKRRNFRVDDRIYLEYRAIAEDLQLEDQGVPDDDVCQNLKYLHDLGSQSGVALTTLRKQHSEIANYLSLLDRRIEVLTSMVGSIGMGDEIKPTTEVNISAGGLSFTAPEPLNVGQRLLLKMVLFPSRLCMQISVHVVYCYDAPSRNNHLAGVTFDAMPEELEDELIRHLLETQSLQLRRERESN